MFRLWRVHGEFTEANDPRARESGNIYNNDSKGQLRLVISYIYNTRLPMELNRLVEWGRLGESVMYHFVNEGIVANAMESPAVMSASRRWRATP